MQFLRLYGDRLPRLLHFEIEIKSLVLLNTDVEGIRVSEAIRTKGREQRLPRTPKCHNNPAGTPRHAFSRSKIKRDAAPSIVLDFDAQGNRGFSSGIFLHTRLVAIAGIL